MTTYLTATAIIDSDHPSIRAHAREVVGESTVTPVCYERISEIQFCQIKLRIASPRKQRGEPNLSLRLNLLRVEKRADDFAAPPRRESQFEIRIERPRDKILLRPDDAHKGKADANQDFEISSNSHLLRRNAADGYYDRRAGRQARDD